MLVSAISFIAVLHSDLHSLSGVTCCALHDFSGRLSRLTHAVCQRKVTVFSGSVGIVATLKGVKLVLAVFFNESSEVLNGAGAGVGQRLGLGASGEELDGWEALDLIGDIIGGRVNLGDGDVGAGRVFGGELIILGCEAVRMFPSALCFTRLRFVGDNNFPVENSVGRGLPMEVTYALQ